MSTSGASSRTPVQTPRSGTTSTQDDYPYERGLAKPDHYHGERYKLQPWLTQVQLYVTLSSKLANDKEKVLFAISYLRGDAEKWVQPYVSRYLDGKQGDDDEAYDDV